ncbi:MAG: hypothetical protein NZ926_02745, partial [Candidatus Methanomethylicia archaeon]|nr:hypothetical protein [Candidatus Methanomethylicia archaeon]
EKNIGIAGWNEGFKAGKGDYFLVLDDDSHIETGLIEAINFLENNKNIGILACKIVGGPFTTDHWKDLDDCIGFIGCGALIRKDVINKIGGFAEEMFLYSHEWEYSIRALDQGFKIVYLSKCVVIHRASKKNRSIKRLRTLTTRNELWIVWRYYTGFKKFLLMFRVLFWNMMASRHEGVNSVFYALSGLLKFINMEKNKTIRVNKKVLEYYEKNFWSFKPILPSIIKRAKKLLKRA